jgi:hypothetical protein
VRHVYRKRGVSTLCMQIRRSGNANLRSSQKFNRMKKAYEGKQGNDDSGVSATPKKAKAAPKTASTKKRKGSPQVDDEEATSPEKKVKTEDEGAEDDDEFN